jgi:hypothetical protein
MSNPDEHPPQEPPFHAERHSGYFRRTLTSLRSREPAAEAPLRALIARPLEPDIVAGFWAQRLALNEPRKPPCDAFAT